MSCADKHESGVVELLSVQEFCVKDFCLFDRLRGAASNALEEEKHRFSPELRPVLGIISGEEPHHHKWPSTRLQFYSIPAATWLESVDLRAPIHQVLINHRFVIAVCRNHALFLSPVTLQQQYYIALYSGGETSLVSGGIAALGPRWFAYQDRCPMKEPTGTRARSGSGSSSGTSATTGSTSTDDNPETLSKPASTSFVSMIPSSRRDVMWAMGNAIVDLSSSLLGMSSLWSSSHLSDAIHYTVGYDVRNTGNVGEMFDSTPMQNKEEGGSVTVIDLADERRSTHVDGLAAGNFRVISHFKASPDNALSALAFNPMGTLLAAASERGNLIYIYKIAPRLSPPVSGSEEDSSMGNFMDIFSSHQCLYILKRGVTQAWIKHINFSTDSKLFTATSAPKGTTHLYAINPDGGVVDVISHLDGKLEQAGSSGDINGIGPIETKKLAMIKTSQQGTAAGVATDNQAVVLPSSIELTRSVFGGAINFLPRNSKFMHAYVMLKFDPSGTLSHYRIELGSAEKRKDRYSGRTVTYRNVDPEVQKLKLIAKVESALEWPLQRTTKSRSVSFKPSFLILQSSHVVNGATSLANSTVESGPEATKNRQKMRRETWLSNIELRTCTMPYSPFWLATDMFPLYTYTYTPNSEDQKKMNNPLYQDKLYRDSKPLLPDKIPATSVATVPGNISPRGGVSRDVGGNIQPHAVQNNPQARAQQSQSPHAPLQELPLHSPGHYHTQKQPQNISTEPGIYQQPQIQPPVAMPDAATTTTTVLTTQPQPQPQPQSHSSIYPPVQPLSTFLRPPFSVEAHTKVTHPLQVSQATFDSDDDDDDSSSDDKPKRAQFLPPPNNQVKAGTSYQNPPDNDDEWIDGRIQLHGQLDTFTSAAHDQVPVEKGGSSSHTTANMTASMLFQDAVSANKV